MSVQSSCYDSREGSRAYSDLGSTKGFCSATFLVVTGKFSTTVRQCFCGRIIRPQTIDDVHQLLVMHISPQCSMTYNLHRWWMTVPLRCLNLLVSSVESKATPVIMFHCCAHRPEFPSLRGPYLHVTYPAAGSTTSNSLGKCFDIYPLVMVSMSPTSLVRCD